MTNFFSKELQQAAARLPLSPSPSRLQLDKNEQTGDLDIALKLKLADALIKANWNRYPSADCSDIEKNVADYCGLLPENIVLSPGSANLITTLLNYFALNKKDLVITHPSYSLFEYHCKTYNITYEPWMLNRDLEFDLNNLPELDNNSVLIITAPNNPIGISISEETLESILSCNPDSLIIVDGVYTEFAKTDFTSLINKYDNLIVLRSFSKAFPVAGLRLGYLCANSKIAAAVKKLVLQFSLNHFTQIFAREILFDSEFMLQSKQRVGEIKIERERMQQYLKQRFTREVVHAYPSEGNFILIKIKDRNAFNAVTEAFNTSSIKVLNTSNDTLLKNTLRISVGSQRENDAVLYCLTKALKQVSESRLQLNQNNFNVPVNLLQKMNTSSALN